IMGPDRDAVLRLIGERDGVARIRGTRDLMLDKSRNYALTEVWKTRFKQLGAYPPFQHVQVDVLRQFVDLLVERAGRLGLRSERAIAFLHRAGGDFGISEEAVWSKVGMERSNFMTAVGRPPDEQEMLLLLANGLRPVVAQEYESRLGKTVVTKVYRNLLAYAL